MPLPRLLAFLVLALTASAATPLQESVRQWRATRESELIGEYLDFLAIPNVTLDRANIGRNADYLVGMMKRRGIEARLLTLPSSNTNPIVYGEVRVPGATKTLMLYAHFDGVAVNPAQWAAGWEPFRPRFATAPAEQGGRLIEWQPGQPVDPSWRITGRGSADDKAGVMVILNAYESLRAAGVLPTANLRFCFEAEEEVGSPNLQEMIRAHRDALTADLWLILDGPKHPSGRKAVIFGSRGSVPMQLTVFGAKRPLHSGNYGNWAINPALELATLLASMKDEHGRVTVAGFYDDVTPLTPAEQAAVAAIPPVEDELRRELGLARAEVPGRTLYEGFTLPTLNINGLQAANVGTLAANIIPSVARAALDLRLVAGNDARRQVEKVIAHIKSRGWQVLDRDPTDEERSRYPRLIRIDATRAGLNAQRTPMDSPIGRQVVAAVQSTVDYPVVRQPTLGGTLPLIVIERELGSRILTVPVTNADSNQHAENENVLVQSLWEGIETYATLMTMAWTATN